MLSDNPLDILPKEDPLSYRAFLIYCILPDTSRTVMTVVRILDLPQNSVRRWVKSNNWILRQKKAEEAGLSALERYKPFLEQDGGAEFFRIVTNSLPGNGILAVFQEILSGELLEKSRDLPDTKLAAMLKQQGIPVKVSVIRQIEKDFSKHLDGYIEENKSDLARIGTDAVLPGLAPFVRAIHENIQIKNGIVAGNLAGKQGIIEQGKPQLVGEQAGRLAMLEAQAEQEPSSVDWLPNDLPDDGDDVSDDIQSEQDQEDAPLPPEIGDYRPDIEGYDPDLETFGVSKDLWKTMPSAGARALREAMLRIRRMQTNLNKLARQIQDLPPGDSQVVPTEIQDNALYSAGMVKEIVKKAVQAATIAAKDSLQHSPADAVSAWAKEIKLIDGAMGYIIQQIHKGTIKPRLTDIPALIKMKLLLTGNPTERIEHRVDADEPLMSVRMRAVIDSGNDVLIGATMLEELEELTVIVKNLPEVRAARGVYDQPVEEEGENDVQDS